MIYCSLDTILASQNTNLRRFREQYAIPSEHAILYMYNNDSVYEFQKVASRSKKAPARASNNLWLPQDMIDSVCRALFILPGDFLHFIPDGDPFVFRGDPVDSKRILTERYSDVRYQEPSFFDNKVLEFQFYNLVKKRKLSLEEIAAITGVDCTQKNKFCQERERPGYFTSTLSALCNFFECGINDLLKYVGQNMKCTI